MKTINFITGLPAQKHRQLVRWYKTIVFLSCIFVVSAVALHIKQWLTWAALQQEMASLHNATQLVDSYKKQKNSLLALENTINAKLAICAQFKTNLNHTIQRIDALQKAIGNDGSLESVTWNTNEIRINTYCNTTQSALTVAHTIEKMPHCTALHLTTLKPNLSNNKILISLHGQNTHG